MLTVHHLAYSRSTRVIWLLEEISAPYEIVRYERDEKFRAPPELKAVHPLGKAPVITDGGLVLGESSVILAYVDERYGGGRMAPPRGSNAFFDHEEWLQYAESTAGFPIMSLAIGARLGGFSEPVDGFFRFMLAKSLDHIAGSVEKHGHLAGERFMLADIQISYLLVMARHAGLLGGHPSVGAYLDRLEARPAYARAIEIGGPMAPPKR